MFLKIRRDKIYLAPNKELWLWKDRNGVIVQQWKSPDAYPSVQDSRGRTYRIDHGRPLEVNKFGRRKWTAEEMEVFRVLYPKCTNWYLAEVVFNRSETDIKNLAAELRHLGEPMFKDPNGVGAGPASGGGMTDKGRWPKQATKFLMTNFPRLSYRKIATMLNAKYGTDKFTESTCAAKHNYEKNK